MEKRKEGRPGDARAALRRSVRENGYVYCHDICNIHALGFILEDSASVFWDFIYMPWLFELNM